MGNVDCSMKELPVARAINCHFDRARNTSLAFGPDLCSLEVPKNYSSLVIVILYSYVPGMYPYSTLTNTAANLSSS